MDITLIAWAWLALGALLVGLGKGGMPGVGNLTILIFAEVVDPKASVGLLLPVLIAADLVAVTVYRRHVDWPVLWRFMPWMVGGTLLGYATFQMISSAQMRTIMGAIILAMACLHFVRKAMAQRRTQPAAPTPRSSWWFTAGMGSLGGFATMMANAAGPMGQIYLLANGLPKLAFIGTAAWMFFLINLFKVPLQWDLGIISLQSLPLSFSLMPTAALGAWLAPFVVRHLPQKQFEILIWIFIIVAGARLLFA